MKDRVGQVWMTTSGVVMLVVGAPHSSGSVYFHDAMDLTTGEMTCVTELVALPLEARVGYQRLDR